MSVFFNALNDGNYTQAKLCFTGSYPPDEFDMQRITNRFKQKTITNVKIVEKAIDGDDAIVKVQVTSSASASPDTVEVPMKKVQDKWKIFYTGYNAFWRK